MHNIFNISWLIQVIINHKLQLWGSHEFKNLLQNLTHATKYFGEQLMGISLLLGLKMFLSFHPIF
jgi:hypothetical protein